MMKRLLSGLIGLSLICSCISPALAEEVSPPDVETPPALSTPALPEVPPTDNEDDPPVIPGGNEDDQEPLSPPPILDAPDGSETTQPAVPPLPATPTFPDLVGHWSESLFTRAVAEGYLNGFEDGTMRPDDAIASADMIRIVERYLGMEKLTAIPPLQEDRASAFVLLDVALSLSAGDERSLPEGYHDAYLLNAREYTATAALVNGGVIQGYEDGSLRPRDAISRAEFISILYRILPTVTKTVPAQLDDAILLTESGSLENQSFSDSLYMGNKTGPLRFENVTTPRLVLLGHREDTPIEITHKSNLGTLILSQGSSANLKLSKDSRIDTLIITSQQARVSLDGPVNRVIVLGQENQVTLDGTVGSLILGGNANIVDGKGSTPSATISGSNQTMELTATTETIATDEGIFDATLRLDAPATLPVGELLTVTATLQNRQVRDCTAVWTVNGSQVKEETITASTTGGQSQYLAGFVYSKDMTTECNISLEVRYTTEQGLKQTQKAEALVQLDNHPADYYDQYSVEKVLQRVTSGYIGDYTTAWAEQNDYDTKTKEIWMNAKGHASRTEYLVWINITYQRVNVFQGSQGNWTLIKSFLGGTGRRGHDTPVGVYTVGTRTASGWTTSSYNVRPVVRFKMGSGLAFHSRKYDPRHTKMIDPSIAFPVSLGCIRMYDDDIWWIYDTIPEGTTVVVY